MKLLFVHQNFPGQYKHLAGQYAADAANTVVALREARPDRPLNSKRIRLLEYEQPKGASTSTHHYLRETEACVRRGQMVVRSLVPLRQEGFRPDVICVHPAWGEGLFLKDVFPEARVLSFWEFYYNGADSGLRPGVAAEARSTISHASQERNATHELRDHRLGREPDTLAAEPIPSPVARTDLGHPRRCGYETGSAQSESGGPTAATPLAADAAGRSRDVHRPQSRALSRFPRFHACASRTAAAETKGSRAYCGWG